jgi:hypothetical protein
MMQRQAGLRVVGAAWIRLRTRKLDLAALFALTALLGWFWHSRIVNTAQQFTFASADLFDYFVPMYTFVADALRQGRVPFWNPYQACGEPFLAVLQGAFFYPARLLLLLLDPVSATAWSTLLHLAIGATGMFMLARMLGASVVGGLVASMGFTYGFAVPSIYIPAALLEPGVWLPISGVALLRVATTRRWGYVALAAFSIAAPVVAGGYQIAVYSVYGLLLMGSGMLLERRWRTAVLAPSSLTRIVAAGLLAVALSSIQWAPTLLWARETVRSTESLTPAEIDPWATPPVTVANRLFGRRDLLLGMFVPPPLFVLALVGTFFGPRFLLPLLLGGIISFLLSLGPATPWFPLYYVLPGLSMFRVPNRLQYLTVIAASLVAAFGTDALHRWASSAGRSRSFVATAAVLAGLLLTSAISAQPTRLRETSVDRYDLLVGATTLTSALLPPPLVGPAVLAALASTAIGSRTNDSLLPYSQGESLLFRHNLVYRLLARRAGLWRTALIASTLDPTVVPKQAMLNGLYAPDDYEPLLSRRLAKYITLLASGTLPPRSDTAPLSRMIFATDPVALPHLLDMMSVRYIVTHPGARRDARFVKMLKAYRNVAPVMLSPDRRRIQILENPHAVPRAYATGAVRSVPTDDDALRIIRRTDFDPRSEVVLTAGPTGAAMSHWFRTADIVSYEPERVAIRASAESGGALVLTDAFAPGWKATVDGHPVPVWPANYLFRGLPLSAGEHEVVFSYVAPGYRSGRTAAVSALCLLLGVPLVVGFKLWLTR